MTDEAKAFGIFIPIGIIIVVVLIVRACSSSTPPPPAPAQAATTESNAAQAASGGGLKIEGTPGQTPAVKGSTFPEGLDAERVQYLVEIDSQFSAPVVMNLSKTFDNSEVARMLLNKKYIEKGPDGSTQITRDGLMALDLSDLGDHWSFPIAKRSYEKVTYVSRVDDDKYDITVSWHYDATRIGTEMNVKTNARTSVARFTGTGREWALTNWVTPPTTAPTS